MNESTRADRSKAGPVERVLGLFTDVRVGEARMALLMMLTSFLILTAYLIAKVVREPLILSGGGAEIKAYLSAFQVALLLLVVRLYAYMVNKLNRRRLINSVVLFFAACLLVFWLSLTVFGAFRGSGMIYFLWVGIFSLVTIAQFWSFANDVYTPEQGKRLFVLLALGASLGGVFGPVLSGYLLDIAGLYNLLPVSAGVLLLSLLLMNYIEARTPVAGRSGSQTAENDQGFSKDGAMKVLFRNRYLLMIAFLILLTNWVNTTGEYILGRTVEETAAAMFSNVANATDLQHKFIGGFYADFYGLVGLAGLLIQLFLVSRIIKYLGVRFSLMLLPAIAVGGYLAMAFAPVLVLVRWAKTAENSTEYSLNNTVRQILFLPTTREEKYKAKVAIDTIFHRAGDLLSAGLVFLGAGLLSFSLPQFAMIAMGLALVWLILAFHIGKENRRLVNARNHDTLNVTDTGATLQ